MDFNMVELPYSQIVESSDVSESKIQKQIKFRDIKESKGTCIVIEQSSDKIKTIMLYDNGFILYSEHTSEYSLIRTNKKIQQDSKGLFIQF